MPSPRSRRLRLSRLVGTIVLVLVVARPTASMTISTAGDQLILSGLVEAGDFGRISEALDARPSITTVILRNSPGGDALTGYHVGAMLRQRGLHTAVSGNCFSSCSRMFLGGRTRAFTEDYAPEFTRVGFHGHYDDAGRLMPEAVRSLGLKAWIIQYSDGKADENLVERWINIPVGRGGAMFYPPAIADRHGAAAFFCNGSESTPPFGCERLWSDALSLGVVTTLVSVHSNDETDLRRRLTPPRPTTFATIDDVEAVPLRAEAGRQEYRRFLTAPPPRAFAVAEDGTAWAWNADDAEAMASAVARCQTRAKGPCRLYAVDASIVWSGAKPRE